MTRTHRSSRPWDPTPQEAEVTRCAVELVSGFDEMIAQLQAQRAAAIEIAMGVALAQHERYERIPVGETREGEPIFDRDDAPVRAMIAELSAATRCSRRVVAAEVDDVWQLAHRFDGVRASFCAGEVDAARASVLVGEGARLSDGEMRAEFERLALPHARAKTVYGTEMAARRIAAELEPQSIGERQERARRERGVFVRALDDGMAELTVVSDAVTVFGAHDRLSQMARRVVAARGTAAGPAGGAGAENVAVRCDACERAANACEPCAEVARAAAEAFAEAAGASAGAAAGASAGAGTTVSADATDTASAAGATATVVTETTRAMGVGITAGPVAADGSPIVDERTFSQVRADLAIDLLLTGQPDAHRAADPTGLAALGELRGRVQVTIPVATLAGLDDAPADLSGYGPVAEAVANPVAAAAGTWARVFRQPGTGALLTVDRYTPTAEQRRFLVARSDTCEHPHCERRATAADMDHTVDYAHGGKTVVTNLGALCRFHHTLKHTTAWRYRRLSNGDVAWTSPAGKEYRSRPGPTVRFVDAEQAQAARRRHRDAQARGESASDAPTSSVSRPGSPPHPVRTHTPGPHTTKGSASPTRNNPASGTGNGPVAPAGNGPHSFTGDRSASSAPTNSASRPQNDRASDRGGAPPSEARPVPSSRTNPPAPPGGRPRASGRAARRPAPMRRMSQEEAKSPF